MGQIEVVQESNITGGFKTWTIWIRVSSFRAYEVSSIDLGRGVFQTVNLILPNYANHRAKIILLLLVQHDLEYHSDKTKKRMRRRRLYLFNKIVSKDKNFPHTRKYID